MTAKEEWIWIPGHIGLHRVEPPAAPSDGREMLAEMLEKLGAQIREHGVRASWRRDYHHGPYPFLERRGSQTEIDATVLGPERERFHMTIHRGRG